MDRVAGSGFARVRERHDRVVRQAIDPETNPWGLALDGYASDGPRRLTDAELSEPSASGSNTGKEPSK